MFYYKLSFFSLTIIVCVCVYVTLYLCFFFRFFQIIDEKGCFSSNEITENHEINVNTRTSDELSLRSSSISSNVSLSEELINPIEFNHHQHQHQHPHYHLTIDEMDERKEHTTKCTHDQFELNETIMKDDSFTATDSITVTNANRSKSPIYIGAGEIRNRLKEQCELQPHKSFRVSISV